MVSSPTSPSHDSEVAQPWKAPSLRSLMISLWPSIFLNAVCVFVVYHLVKHFTSASDVVALALSAIPALIGTLIGLIRQRRIDVLGAFSLITIALSLVLALTTGDARLMLIRESILFVLFGVIGLISLLFPKPIWYYIIGYVMTGNDPARMAAYNTAWKTPLFRTVIRAVTILWGIVYVVEFLVMVEIVYNLPVTEVLTISPFMSYGCTILAIYITRRMVRRIRSQREQPQALAAEPGKS